MKKTYSQFKQELLEEGYTVKLLKRGFRISGMGKGRGKIGPDKYTVLDTKSGTEMGSAKRYSHNDLMVKMNDGSGFNIIGASNNPQKEINRHVKFERKAKKFTQK